MTARVWNQDLAQAGRQGDMISLAERRAHIEQRNGLARAVKWADAQRERHPNWFNDDIPEGGDQ